MRDLGPPRRRLKSNAIMPGVGEVCGIWGRSDYEPRILYNGPPAQRGGRHQSDVCWMSARRQEMTTNGQTLSDRPAAKQLMPGTSLAPVGSDAEGVRLAAFPAVTARGSTAGFFLLCLTIQI